MSSPDWHILGAGAIGCLAAEALAGAGCTPILLQRADAVTIPSILTIERDDTCSEQAIAVEAADSSEQIKKLLIATKAYDVMAAVSSIEQRLSGECEIVLLVNGMGIAEQLHGRLATAHIFPATTTNGAYRIAPLHVHHAGIGETHIGALKTAVNSQCSADSTNTPPAWFAPWAVSSLHCCWAPDIDAALWSKLAVNCVINPLTAVHRCRNGELTKKPALAAEVDALCREVMQVSYAAGYTGTAQNLHEAVAAVIAGTADNRSSMLEDVERTRPTEIDYITGYLLDIAERHGIVAPHNRTLYEKVKSLA